MRKIAGKSVAQFDAETAILTDPRCYWFRILYCFVRLLDPTGIYF